MPVDDLVDAVVTSWDDETAIRAPAPHDPRLTQLLDRRFVVIAEPAALRAALETTDAVTVRQLLPTLGIAELDADRTAAEMLAARLDRHGKVLPSIPWNTAAATIVRGLDWIVSHAIAQGSGASDAFGGRVVGAPDRPPQLQVAADGRWELTDGPDVPAPPALLPLVNMSFGPRAVTFPFLPNDIVNLATYAASRHVAVVMAAGNTGRFGPATVSAWARADWVLCVGATSDADGTAVADYSARGGPGVPGPDVVALGRSAVDPHPNGTSFAAPRVVGAGLVLVAAWCQLGRALRIAGGAPDHGVPLVGCGVLDSFGDEIWRTPDHHLRVGSLPVGAVDDAVAGRLVELLADAGLGHDLRMSADFVRTQIVASATTIPGGDPQSVGAGFVDDQRVLDPLRRLTGLDVVHALHGTVALAAAVESELARLHPFDTPTLAAVEECARRTSPRWHCDRSTARVAVVPADDGLLAQLDEPARSTGLALPAAGWAPPG